jgi:sortase A
VLFVVYELYVTNWLASGEQVQVRAALRQTWAQGRDPLQALPDGSVRSLPVGTGIANLYIPRLGRDFAWTVVEGTGVADLEKGPGHYSFSARPGQVGDFALAGHRVGKGQPFLNLDQLRPGDAVLVETETHWYVYRVLPRRGGPDGVPWREIVDPSDGAVVDPVPDHPELRATHRFLTMTTCHPKFTAAKRLVIHALLAQTLPRSGTGQPAAISRLYQDVGA